MGMTITEKNMARHAGHRMSFGRCFDERHHIPTSA